MLRISILLAAAVLTACATPPARETSALETPRVRPTANCDRPPAGKVCVRITGAGPSDSRCACTDSETLRTQGVWPPASE
jgi:hypothetical protein